MKIEQTHIEHITKQFADLQSKEDLVKLLSDAKNMLYGEECKPVQLKSLTYYANPTFCKKRYQIFTIKKKSGADRTIHAPVKGLKSILRSLNFVLQCMHEPHEAATGFVRDKSIVDNAKKHVGHHYVLNLDLKDFFHSFDRNRVKMGFIYEPFNLGGDKEPLAFLLASLCTHPFEIEGEVKTVLPQGSPTSPTITNILCKKLDRRLNGLANRFGATFTRYADDITFSSPHNIYNDEAFNKELKRIIEEDQQLAINPKKTRLQKSGYRQEATGLIVNDKVNVRRRYVKQIRMWLYCWEKYGYEKAEQIFKRDYIADKGHVKNTNAHLVNVLDGKLEFLKMVKGEDDGTYKGLKKRFVKLVGIKDPFNKVLDVWEEDGIENAMNIFYTDKLGYMAKNKYDFIKELLEDKKINQNQRERILKLVSKEISIEGTLEERIQKIEEIIYNRTDDSKVEKTDMSSKSKDSSLPGYIDPYHLYKFLFEYNQNPVLRSTCHDIDSEELNKINDYCDSDSYNFKKHLKKIIESFDEHEKKLFAPHQVKALIRGYLTGKDYKGNQLNRGWSSVGIKINWSSNKLNEWITKNPNIPPNLNENMAGDREIELLVIEPQINSPITYNSIQSFTQLVLHFKNLFHLRSGSQGLRAILERVNSIKKWNKKVEFEITDQDFPNNLEHFTDVDKLIQAYNKLLQLIIEQHKDDKKPKVKLRFYEEDQRVYLSVHHLNGQYNKTVQNCIDRPHGRDYKNLISSQINGLCNLYLKADFGNEEFGAINLWDGKKTEAEKLPSFTGVEHILEFPKIKEA